MLWNAVVGASLLAPEGVAIDAAGKIWIANTVGGGVSEVVAGCNSGSCTGHNFNPGGTIDDPIAVAIDGSGNVWLANRGSQNVTEVTSGGALVGDFAPAGANFSGPSGIAIDASGNVWVSNCGTSTCFNIPGVGSVSEFVGAASPVLTRLAACLAKPSPSAVCVP
jgi:streptogramin lyase